MERLVRAVDVDAGKSDQSDAGRQRGQGSPCLGSVGRRHVYHCVSVERGELGPAAGPRAALGVQVLHAMKVCRLCDPAVSDKHSMPRRRQSLGNRAADEPCPA
jgi:hypothetical protein